MKNEQCEQYRHSMETVYTFVRFQKTVESPVQCTKQYDNRWVGVGGRVMVMVRLTRCGSLQSACTIGVTLPLFWVQGRGYSAFPSPGINLFKQLREPCCCLEAPLNLLGPRGGGPPLRLRPLLLPPSEAPEVGGEQRGLVGQDRQLLASAHEAPPPPLRSASHSYLCERCVRTVRYAPICAATRSASERQQCRLAAAIAAWSSLNVASWMRSVAPRPAATSASLGRVSPEYTTLHPAE
eukprot:scaffold3944_cov111-Isochrysis_galbana.AAC.10